MLGTATTAQAYKTSGDGRVPWDPDYVVVASCTQASPMTAHIDYSVNTWDNGDGPYPIVIEWGDGTTTQVPDSPAPDPVDPGRPYELDHTYPDGFDPVGHVLTDNAHDWNPDFVLPLDVLAGTCQPPPETPEVPYAIVLPLGAIAIVGLVLWRQHRRTTGVAARG